MIRFYDTCAILNLQDKLLNGDDKFYISSVTVQELEHIKDDKTKTEDVRYKARKASHIIDNNPDRCSVVVFDDTANKYIEIYNLKSTDNINDIRICATAAMLNDKNQDVVFYSDDVLCKIFARDIFHLDVQNISNKEEIDYKGYRLLRGNTAFINEKMSSLEYKSSFFNNEYLLIYNEDDDKESEMRFFNGEFLPLKLPSSKYIKGKNALQRCALDMLNNPNITIAGILGSYGSGKSYLAMRMGLYWMNEKGTVDKILGVRSPEGEGKEVGFLPGDLEDKTDKFFLPLEQQLEGGEFELASLKQQDKLESTIPFYMKGTTYNHTIILCDEAEDLTQKEIKLVGTRIGEGSRIFFSGDYKQSVVNTSKSNALVRMCDKLKGNPKFACIFLDEDVRSDTSKIFADLDLN